MWTWVFLVLAVWPLGVGAQVRVLPVGDSITAGALGGPNSPAHDRGGYRYFLERFLEGSEGGASGFEFKGSRTAVTEWGTIASYAGQWFAAPKPLNHPFHSGYPGYSIGQIEALVASGTIPVADSDVVLLQIGTNNVQYGNTTPATPAEIASWKTAYDNLLAAILAKSATVKVVLAKIPPVTNGANLGNAGANTARIVPFNEQVVAVVHAEHAAAHPGRFFLVDNFSPLNPGNAATAPGFAGATNHHDFFTGLGDGVHPYNAGHRKFAANFWRALQIAGGAVDATLVTPLDDTNADGIGGEDIGLLGNGGKRNSTNTGPGDDVFDQPFVRASSNPTERAKFYLKLDLAGVARNWDEARFNLVFWGAPTANPDWGNCCDDASASTTLRLYGIPDGQDTWTETGITWANAPGNLAGGNGVAGIPLGDLVVPTGASTGDIISVSTPALRDFINHHRGNDGLVTFVVAGVDVNPSLRASFQDSDFRDYAPPFLQLTRRPTRVLPVGDSITAGALGGPNSGEFYRGGYRYYLERFLEGSEDGPGGFRFTGSINEPDQSSWGTIASFAGQWFAGARPLNHPLHSGYSGHSIEQITALVDDGTIPVQGSDLLLLQIGTNNVQYNNPNPATPTEIAAWKSAYEALLAAILAKSPDVKVAMAKIPPVTNGQSSVLAANAARLRPFNEQVVAAVHAQQAALYPGRLFLVDNFSSLDPFNASDDATFVLPTNEHDFFTGYGDGVHPYNGGHRKMAGNFWRATRLADGARDARLLTPLDDPDGDGTAGADITLLSNGGKRNGTGTGGGTDVFDQAMVVASADANSRAKFYVKLDLSGLPKTWDDARFNLVFWGAPAANPDWGNCCDDMPGPTTLRLHGVPDGGDHWTEASITWANAPGNLTNSNGVAGQYLGDIIVPAGAKSGDIVGVSTPALRNFINHHRGRDGMVTFVITGATEDPGFLVSFQDSDFRDYAPPFLQLVDDGLAVPPSELAMLHHTFDFTTGPVPVAELTFSSGVGETYLVSGSDDLLSFDEVLLAGIPGAAGQTTVQVPLPPGRPRLFLRVERQ